MQAVDEDQRATFGTFDIVVIVSWRRHTHSIAIYPHSALAAAFQRQSSGGPKGLCGKFVLLAMGLE